MAQSVEHILGKDEVTSSSLVSSSIKSHEKLVGFFIPSNQPFTYFNLIVECEHNFQPNDTLCQFMSALTRLQFIKKALG